MKNSPVECLDKLAWYFHEVPLPSQMTSLVSFWVEMNIFTPLKVNVCFDWMPFSTLQHFAVPVLLLLIW